MVQTAWEERYYFLSVLREILPRTWQVQQLFSPFQSNSLSQNPQHGQTNPDDDQYEKGQEQRAGKVEHYLVVRVVLHQRYNYFCSCQDVRSLLLVMLIIF